MSFCVCVINMLSPFSMQQGSMLGPLLLTLYINDLSSVCNDVDLIKYADDTVLYTYGKNATEVAVKLMKEMFFCFFTFRYKNQ